MELRDRFEGEWGREVVEEAARVARAEAGWLFNKLYSEKTYKDGGPKIEKGCIDRGIGEIERHYILSMEPSHYFFRIDFVSGDSEKTFVDRAMKSARKFGGVLGSEVYGKRDDEIHSFYGLGNSVTPIIGSPKEYLGFRRKGRWENISVDCICGGVGIESKMQLLWGMCCCINDAPQVVVTTWEIAQKLGLAEFNGVPVVTDRWCPEDTMYLLNFNHLELVVYECDDFNITGAITCKENTEHAMRFISFSGGIVNDYPARHGILYNIE